VPYYIADNGRPCSRT